MDESVLREDLLKLGLDATIVNGVVRNVQIIKSPADHAGASVNDLKYVHSTLLKHLKKDQFDAQAIAKMKFVIANMLLSDARKMSLQALDIGLANPQRDVKTILRNLIVNRIGNSTSQEYSRSDKDLLKDAIEQVVRAMEHQERPSGKTGGGGRGGGGGQGGRGGGGATKRKFNKQHAATSPATQEQPAETTSEDRDYTHMSSVEFDMAGVSQDNKWVSAWNGKAVQVGAQHAAETR